MAKAIDNMQRAIETFKQRNQTYGDNYLHFGRVMMALFPRGIRISSEHDWNRMGIFIQIMSKLTRYVVKPNEGHIDSIHDMGVYAFMLEELDGLFCNICGALLTNGACLSCDVVARAGHDMAREALASHKPHHYVLGVCTQCGDQVRSFNEQMEFLRSGGNICSGKKQIRPDGYKATVDSANRVFDEFRGCEHVWQCPDPNCDGSDCYTDTLKCVACGQTRPREVAFHVKHIHAWITDPAREGSFCGNCGISKEAWEKETI